MDNKKNFWTTIPGVLTAITGLITAIGGLLAVLSQIGVLGNSVGNNPTIQNTRIGEISDSRPFVLRSPALGIEFLQEGRTIPLVVTGSSGQELELSLSPQPFEIRTPILTDWKARVKGGIGCPPTSGLRVALGIGNKIYQTPTSGWNEFFSCMGAYISMPYGTGKLVVNSRESTGDFNYLGHDRSRVVSEHLKSYAVSKITFGGTQGEQNLLRPDTKLYGVFHIDLDGDDQVGSDEIELITILFLKTDAPVLWRKRKE